MTVEKTKDFIKLSVEEGYYILSKNDNQIIESVVYLSYLDAVDNYIEITADEAQQYIDGK